MGGETLLAIIQRISRRAATCNQPVPNNLKKEITVCGYYFSTAGEQVARTKPQVGLGIIYLLLSILGLTDIVSFYYTVALLYCK